MSYISIVIPLYNEAIVLPQLMERLSALIASQATHQWEVVLVNDGSSDETPDLLKAALTVKPWLTTVHLSRNFGHQIAMAAGLDQSRGEAVIVMDGDLQDPPEVIPEMIAQWQAGFDVVYATRRKRAGETFFKKASAAFFYRLIEGLTEIPLPIDTGDFRLISRRVVDQLNAMPERHRFFRGLVSWIGFQQTAVYFDRAPRQAGHTKNSLRAMLRFAGDGLVGFSDAPLRWLNTIGLLLMLTCLIVSILCGITHASLNSSCQLMILGIFLAGLQLFGLGIVGAYLSRTLTEVRQRPLYIIDRLERHEQAP